MMGNGKTILTFREDMPTSSLAARRKDYANEQEHDLKTE